MNCCFYTIFSRIILKHISPKISHCHEKSFSTDCFSIVLYKDTEKYLFGKAAKDNICSYQYNGEKFDKDKVVYINYQDLIRYDIGIKHYYKFSTFNYNSLFRWICTGLTRIDIVKCNILILRERLTQYLFDRKSKESI